MTKADRRIESAFYLPPKSNEATLARMLQAAMKGLHCQTIIGTQCPQRGLEQDLWCIPCRALAEVERIAAE